MNTPRSCGLAALLLALAFAAGARAQEPAPAPGDPTRLVYEANFFAQYAPQTALDMIRRTPGFSLNEGTARRGFSGAVGNVLVDGERPVAKSQSLADVLQRIPAAQVVRIELLRGGAAAGDASGYAVLANVVRTGSSSGGAWQVGAEHAGRGPMPQGWATWSGRAGRTDYSLGANGYSMLRTLAGTRTLTDAGGALTGTRDDRSPRNYFEAALDGEASRAMLGGLTRLTGQLAFNRYHEDSTLTTFAPGGALVESEFNPYTQRKRTAEGGLSHERGLGAWDLTLDALATRIRFESEITSTRRDAAGEVGSVFAQALTQDSGEAILRATLQRDLSARHRLEGSIEGARNTLEQRLALTFDDGAGPVPLPVPNSNLAVRERRGDATLAWRWTPGPRWSVETRLAGEFSRLSFTGDADQAVDLAYFKPSLQLTRGIGGKNQLRLRIHRDVSQLDFTDFVSAASLADDTIEGGNPDLRPQTAWRLEATADLHFGRSGAVSLTLFRAWLSDAIDRVPITGPDGVRFDAPGNIGSGQAWGAELVLELPLGPVVPGGSFKLDGTWQDSRVTDPVTGARRGASNFAEAEFEAEFRQDLARRKLAWGLTYVRPPELAFYRFNEIERRRDSPALELWGEAALLKRYKARLAIGQLLDAPERRERAFFAPDRTGALSHVERTERRQGPRVTLTVAGSF